MTCVTVCCFSYNRRCRYIYRTMYYIDRERNIDPSQRHRALTAHHLHTYIINAPTPPPQAPRTTKTNVSIWKIFSSRQTDKRSTIFPPLNIDQTRDSWIVVESSEYLPTYYMLLVLSSIAFRKPISLVGKIFQRTSFAERRQRKKKLYTTVAYSTYSTCNTRFYSIEKSLLGVGK